MSTAEEIKLSLHKLIDSIDDESKLHVVYSSLNEDLDWWDELSEVERASIQRGVDQLDQGKGVPYSEVRKKVDRLLKKYE